MNWFGILIISWRCANRRNPVFAPTNAAFAKLPASTVEGLLKPENKAQLSKILTYHVISGNIVATAVLAAVKAGNGKVELTTVSGGKLSASLENGKVKLTDETGSSAFCYSNRPQR